MKYISFFLSYIRTRNLFTWVFDQKQSAVAQLVGYYTGDIIVASSSLTADGDLEQGTLSAA